MRALLSAAAAAVLCESGRKGRAEAGLQSWGASADERHGGRWGGDDGGGWVDGWVGFLPTD